MPQLGHPPLQATLSLGKGILQRWVGTPKRQSSQRELLSFQPASDYRQLLMQKASAADALRGDERNSLPTKSTHLDEWMAYLLLWSGAIMCSLRKKEEEGSGEQNLPKR